MTQEAEEENWGEFSHTPSQSQPIMGTREGMYVEEGRKRVGTKAGVRK